MKLTLPKRLAVHSILIACSIAFLFPFVWLVMTSLKPIEQTMKMPPEWLPRACYAPVQGERLEVIRERQFLANPIVRVEEGPRRGEVVTVPPTAFRNGMAEIQIEVPPESPAAKPPSAEKQVPPKAPAKTVETRRYRATQVGEQFDPFVFVRVDEGRRKGEYVLLPAAKYKEGVAEVEARIGDRKETQRVKATLRRQVAPGDWLVRERINRLAAEPAALISLAPADILDWPGFCKRIHWTPILWSYLANPPVDVALNRRLAADYAERKAEAQKSGSLELLPPDPDRVTETIYSGAGATELEKSSVIDAINRILEDRNGFMFPVSEGPTPGGNGSAKRVYLMPDPPARLTRISEAQDLLARDRAALTNDEVQRLNRLILEAAFPDEIRNTQRQRLTPRFDVVAASDVSERIQPAWWNYEGAIRYTGYTRFSLLGLSFSVPNFLVYTWNTIVVAVLGMIGAVLSSALAAYGFARIRWRGRDTCFVITLATMMVPFAVTMVPLYGVFRALGWVGTLKPLWVPAFFAGAFNIFLLRQFFMTVPEDLSDAARIDGCSEWGIFWRIILPLSKPALAVVALFHFMWAWKDFMGPLIFLTEQRTFTLSLGLEFYRSQHGGSEWHYLMAASTLMILPVIILFFFTQKTFIQGISTTGMKN